MHAVIYECTIISITIYLKFICVDCMLCFFKGPYFVGVIFARTTFWFPVIIVHRNQFLTVLFLQSH